MRIRTAVSVIATFASVAACSGGDGYLTGGNGGGGGGGGGGAAGTVTVGSGIQFVSGHNATMNPAVDTIVAGSAITWTWKGTLPHSVRSVGTPSFTSSGTQTGSGTYVVTFPTPGSYRYQCDVHGQAMTGTIVVLSTNNASRASDEQTASAADGTGDSHSHTLEHRS
jgi:plastocyanin